MVEMVVVDAVDVFWIVEYIILLQRIYYFIMIFILFYCRRYIILL